MSRTQRVVFRADVSVIIEAPWAQECTIEQVMEQAEREARQVLAKLRAEGHKGVVIASEPRLIRVILDEEEGR